MQNDSTSDHSQEDDWLTPAATPAGRVHHPFLRFLRLGKAMLANAIEAGAELDKEERRLGDSFGPWVDEQLRLTREEVNFFRRCYKQLGPSRGRLSHAVEVKSPEVISLISNMLELSRSGATIHPDSNTTGEINRKRAKKRAAETGSLNFNASESAQAEASMGDQSQQQKESHAGEALAAETPQGQSGRSELTDEERQFLIQHHRKLFLQVRLGQLSPEEAMHQAANSPKSIAT